MSPRRQAILSELRRAGLTVHAPTGPIFGAQLAQLENQSRLLLNVHYYTPGIFESFRVVPAVHRGTPVISERSMGDEGSTWCPCFDYTDLVDATIDFIQRNPET
jgi:hypothetical protein